ncbi:NAD-dependent epimerase/dehydratase [Megasphaera sp. BL7]|jgi:UDP-glucose 4-epimerase|uniref:NAD-dependent epimerase/dehydratase family protein n=1 Tax=unclassified Megasphaera TaxID=2626256 RepID=UPI0003575FEE|nr:MULTISPECIES: NAD-dependent epimerase/dehydratase family protein [unclassified Megasphaera]EPP16609.1 NAD-dependent epimerase/dehydratase [Megasphaera sp. NM10]EPP16893.1 NAD-dependent epimerase/dehydratase [Megasphaera sp. BL7]
MEILITGGAGFIGSHILAQLQGRRDMDVVVFDNLSSGSKEHVPAGMELVEGDVCDEAAVDALFADHHFDAVIHLAAQTMVPTSVEQPVLDCQINLEGVLHVLEACRIHGTGHILFSSSAAVYGDNLHIPLKETERLVPTSPYGITKMATEHYLRVYHELYGMDATVFRFANVYGERQGEKGEGGVVSIFCKLLSQRQGITVFGDGNQTRDFVYAGDIAQAIIRALPLKGCHTMNVSTGQETSINDLIRSFEKAVGYTVPVQYTAPRTGDILRSVLSNEALKRDLGFVPEMDLEEGIRRTYDWYRSQWTK